MFQKTCFSWHYRSRIFMFASALIEHGFVGRFLVKAFVCLDYALNQMMTDYVFFPNSTRPNSGDAVKPL